MALIDPFVEGTPDWYDPVHRALNRMKRAHARCTGCHLTFEMIEALGLTFLAEIWENHTEKGSE